VDHKFGGAGSALKRDNLVATVINLFGDKQGRVQEFKLQDFIEEYLLQKLNCQVDDNSSRWVVRVCMALYDDCVNKKDFKGLAKLLSQRPEFDRNQSGWASGEEDDESDYYDSEYDEEYDEEQEDGKQQSDGKTQTSNTSSSSSVNVDTAPAEPKVDADGWEVVTSKKGRRGH
jgi:hypothetical protein